MGVIDQALPAHDSARLFKIDPHDDLQVIVVSVLQGLQATRVFQCSQRVVDGAGPNDHAEAVVLSGKDSGTLGSTSVRHVLRFLTEGKFLDQDSRWQERAAGTDADIVVWCEH
jgi:sRNA-binding protein